MGVSISTRLWAAARLGNISVLTGGVKAYQSEVWDKLEKTFGEHRSTLRKRGWRVVRVVVMIK